MLCVCNNRRKSAGLATLSGRPSIVKRIAWSNVAACLCVEINVNSPDPSSPNPSTAALTTAEREHGCVFAPKYDAAGLLTAVVIDDEGGAVLVVAYMNAEALDATLHTGKVHFWSRSRGRLWMKGESSGHVLNVAEIRVDCDQDALLIRAKPDGPTCHTGARSCFYRRIDHGDETPILAPVTT